MKNLLKKHTHLFALLLISLPLLFSCCSKDEPILCSSGAYCDQYIEQYKQGNIPPGMSYEDFENIIESIQDANMIFNPIDNFYPKDSL